jgi:hypothetical protein
MKPLLSTKTNIDVLRRKPLNERSVAITMHRKSSIRTFANPFWLASILVLLSGHDALATSVLAIRTPNFLVVGADSLARRGNGIPLGPVCKIRQYGRFYASFAGMSNEEDTGFDVYKVAAKTITKCSTMECAAVNFGREVRTPLIEALAVSRRRDGEAYFEESFLKRAPLQVLIFGQERAATIIRMVVFNVDKTKLRMDLVVDDDGGCPGTCGPQGIAFLGIGSYFLAKDRFQAVFRSGFGNDSPSDVVVKALTEEANADPKAVSAPFSVIVMDRTGIHWQTSYQGACPAIGK